jgi:hypothetical protein
VDNTTISDNESERTFKEAVGIFSHHILETLTEADEIFTHYFFSRTADPHGSTAYERNALLVCQLAC